MSTMTSEEEMQRRQEAFSNAKLAAKVMHKWQAFEETEVGLFAEITLIFLGIHPEQLSQNGATDEPHE